MYIQTLKIIGVFYECEYNVDQAVEIYLERYVCCGFLLASISYINFKLYKTSCEETNQLSCILLLFIIIIMVYCV